MEIAPASRVRKAGWSWLVFLAAGILLTGWLIKTPAGLLGKADAIGYAVCHRIDSHSFHLGERQAPLCARCSGMYLGALLGMAFLGVRGRPGGLPPLKIKLVLGGLLLAFAFDGVNSYMHFFPDLPWLYPPQNWLRLATGSGVGLGIAAFLLPAFNQTLWQEWDPRPALGSWKALLALLGLAVLLDLLVLTENPLIFYPLAVLSAAQIVVLLTAVYTMVLVMVTGRENRFSGWREAAVYLAGGFTIAMLQIAAIDAGRFLFTGTWSGFQF